MHQKRVASGHRRTKAYAGSPSPHRPREMGITLGAAALRVSSPGQPTEGHLSRETSGDTIVYHGSVETSAFSSKAGSPE